MPWSASPSQRGNAFLARLARDTRGNTIALMAAALFPLLAIVGGALDISRGYLAQSRLQQACDAGVLAARKRLGAESVKNGLLPANARKAGERFFGVNFEEGMYGTQDRNFAMELENDYAISGTAAVVVPTTIMAMFGHSEVPLAVECQARLNFSNTDIMMVLDVTGSMAETNPGDSMTRIDTLKETVKTFHAEMGSVANPGTRVRFGFLPYSTNVNVAHLLRDEWVNTDWFYQSRQQETVPGPIKPHTYTRNWDHKTGNTGKDKKIDSYPATAHAGSPGRTYVDENEQVVTIPPGGTYYTCDRPTPPSDYTAKDELLSTSTVPFTGPPTGTQTIEKRRLSEEKTKIWTSRSGSTCNVYSRTYHNSVREYERVTEPRQQMITQYRYNRYQFDMADWRDLTVGCIEERATYEITDYSNVDLSRAIDLDIDRVPDGSAQTRWSPHFPPVIYERSLNSSGAGPFTKAEVVSTQTFFRPAVSGFAPCPAPARALSTINSDELEDYLDTISPNGATYHDIGMIWGGRMLSPKGLYAAANADIDGKPTARHMIFLTDGLTAPMDIAYSSYGVEPLDERRWKPSSPLTLTQTVEKRFAFACNEVKKRNISVWVIGFGTTLNSIMTECAGEGRYFEAANAEELQQVFADIARRMGDLRLSQ